MAREDEIKVIAYSIWEQEGCCDGHDIEHWLKAGVIWEEQQKPKTVLDNIQSHSKPVFESPVKPIKNSKSSGKKSPYTNSIKSNNN